IKENAHVSDFNISHALAQAWQKLDADGQQPYFDEAEEERAKAAEQRSQNRLSAYDSSTRLGRTVSQKRNGRAMSSGLSETNNLTEGEDSPTAQAQDVENGSPVGSGNGFTAVNATRQ